MRALSHSGRPWAPLACCRKGRYSVGVPSGGGGTGLSSQRWRTSKVFVPSSNTFKLICLRATALLSFSHPALMVSHGGRPVPCYLSHRRLQASGSTQGGAGTTAYVVAGRIGRSHRHIEQK